MVCIVGSRSNPFPARFSGSVTFTFFNQVVEGIWFGALRIPSLLFASGQSGVKEWLNYCTLHFDKNEDGDCIHIDFKLVFNRKTPHHRYVSISSSPTLPQPGSEGSNFSREAPTKLSPAHSNGFSRMVLRRSGCFLLNGNA